MDRPPNIVIILCDQLRPFEVGCYGHRVVRTPNIDRLAEGGVRFETAVSNNPVCTPARSILLSGQYGRTCTGMLGNWGAPTPTRIRLKDPTLAEVLADMGCQAAHLGKWHICPHPALVGFGNHPPPGQEDPACPLYFPLRSNWQTEKAFTPDYEMRLLRLWLDAGPRRPFFLFFNINLPHSPWCHVPRRYLEMYGRDQAVPELLLPKFGDRYQVVERSQLEAILKEVDLTIAQVVDNPALLKGKKLSGVRYLVLGSVTRLGNISISARLVDIVRNPGDHVQTAEVSAEDARGLQAALSELVKILQMTDAEKKAYLDERQYPQLLSEARAKAAAREFDAAVGLYRRALAIRSSPEIDAELAKVLADQIAWEKLQADQRQKERDFQRLLAQARSIADGLPADKEKLSEAQKAEVGSGLKAVQAALAYKPADPTALALKDRLESYLASARELTLDLGGGVTMKLVLIPAGKFLMGSPKKEQEDFTKSALAAGIKEGSFELSDEGPQHEVTISGPFYMGVYEVTQEQYEQIVGSNPSEFKGKTNPVENVSWDDAVEFCKKLSTKTGKTVTLPTEAQWEYACRAGSKTRFSFGDDDSGLRDYAWYTANSDDKTHPAGEKKPNAFGLYDMHGNVWEWCSDWYADSYANAKNQDPAGPASGSCRVLRGGGWYGTPRYCRSADRLGGTPDGRYLIVGFRVAVDLK